MKRLLVIALIVLAAFALLAACTRPATSAVIASSAPVSSGSLNSSDRANALADAWTYGLIWGGVLLGLVVIVGVAFILGATANRIQSVYTAEKIKAEAEAQAIIIRAGADADRARHWQVTGATNIVSSKPDGELQVVSVAGAFASQQSDLKPLPTFRRVLGMDHKNVEDVCRLSPLGQQAVDYLRRCAEISGWEAQRLPSASETGDNSERQPVVEALKAHDRVYTKKGNPTASGSGSYLIGEYQTIRALHDALLAGDVIL
jgi:hypothetical protein